MSESRSSVIVVGVFGSLTLAFVGLLIGAWISQFFAPPSLLLFLPSLAMNIALGLPLIRKGKRPELGKAFLFGGTIASVALPFILL